MAEDEIEYQVPSPEPGGKPIKRTARVKPAESGDAKTKTRTVHVVREEPEGSMNLRDALNRARKEL